MKYLVVSDIHLGHPVNKTSNIANNFKNFLTDYDEQLKGLEVLFIAGDTFDSCLSTYQEDYLLAMELLTYIINWCSEHNCKLRILEGTPSHDWKQVKVVYEILDKLKLSDTVNELDFKYIDKLSIETLNNKTILYIPDEWNDEAKKTYDDVVKLLKPYNGKVDTIIMHGQFEYQIPLGLRSSHDEALYEELCNGYIHPGHIHTSSTHGKILAQGSFDRLAHSEEEPKGAYLVDGDKYEFLVNQHAMLFLTYDLRDLDDLQMAIELKTIDTMIPHGSALRFIVSSRTDFLYCSPTIKNILPNYRVKIIVKDGDTTSSLRTLTKEENLLVNSDIQSFEIRPDNIVELVHQELLQDLDNHVNDTLTLPIVNRAMDKFKNIVSNKI